jgi:hypothetical protein
MGYASYRPPSAIAARRRCTSIVKNNPMKHVALKIKTSLVLLVLAYVSHCSYANFDAAVMACQVSGAGRCVL